MFRFLGFMVSELQKHVRENIIALTDISRIGKKLFKAP
jgi:hypothetical protein